MLNTQRLILLSLYIIESAVFGIAKKNAAKFLSEADCGSDEEYCDLSRLSNGLKFIEINSSGTYWKVKENEACNVVLLTFHEPVTIDESIMKTCNQLEKITFKGSNYDCKIDLWMNVLKFVSWDTTWISSDDTNCSSLLDLDAECGNIPNFIYQILCMDTLRKFGGSPCKFGVKMGDYSIDIDCINKTLEDSDLPKQLPQRSKQLSMEGNRFRNVDGWLETVLPQLHMVEQINFSRNRLIKLPVLPLTNNPIKHIYVERNSQDFEFDVAAFASYLHYQNLVLSFKRTKWICNCKARDLVDLLIDKTRIFNDWQVMFCAGKIGRELQRPWDVDYSHCPSREPFDSLLFLVIPLLSAVNILVIAIFVDLNIVIWREKKGLTNRQAPWIHAIFIKITGLNWLDIETDGGL